jgi:uncharacterized membrane protein
VSSSEASPGDARTPRGRLGWLMASLAVAALVVALYLGVTKLLGGVPTCDVVGGCDRVAASEYSVVLGVPVGLLGAGASLVTLAGALAWWLRGDRRGLYGAYGIGLMSLPVLAWLTWLEVAVIEAVCIWCVAYAVLVVGGWLAATLALTGARDTPAPSGP